VTNIYIIIIYILDSKQFTFISSSPTIRY